METIGKVNDILSERYFEWRIENFSALSTDDDKGYESPLFHFVNAYWYLTIYPNGEKVCKSIGNVGAYLIRKCSGPPISLDFTLSLKEIDKTDKHASYVFRKPETGYGWKKIIKRSDVLKRTFELGMSDVVTVICTMKFLESINDAVTEKLSQDLKGMMLNGCNGDVTVKVKGVEFLLHRNILVSRSSYYNSMFRNDMKEKNTGVVTIDDCEPDVFRNFVHFLYTGKLDKLSTENVCALYETADKYQEDQLKKICLDFMMKTISEYSLSDYIALALKYDENELFEKVEDFLKSHPKEFFCSVKWEDFAKEYPAYEPIIETLDHHDK